MKKKLMVSLATGILLFGVAKMAKAASFSYDFGSLGYTEGQNFENVTLDYATFTSETGSVKYTDSFGSGLMSGPGAEGDIYINFSQAVSDLSFTAGDGAGDTDAFAVTLYEFGTGNLFGTWNSPQFGGDNEPEWYTLMLSVGNVGKAVFDPANAGVLPGHLGEPYGGVVLTNFGYNTTNTVPEPSTMLLFVTGIAGLAGTRLVRKKL